MALNRVIHPGYQWSEDYDLLVELLRQGNVIGTVLYDGKYRDPVMFRTNSNEEFKYSASCRGIHYFETYNSSEYTSQEDEFKHLCAECGAQFLAPVTEASA